jgi:preprotein translocase subunit SecA
MSLHLLGIFYNENYLAESDFHNDAKSYFNELDRVCFFPNKFIEDYNSSKREEFLGDLFNNFIDKIPLDNHIVEKYSQQINEYLKLEGQNKWPKVAQLFGEHAPHDLEQFLNSKINSNFQKQALRQLYIVKYQFTPDTISYLEQHVTLSENKFALKIIANYEATFSGEDVKHALFLSQKLEKYVDITDEILLSIEKGFNEKKYINHFDTFKNIEIKFYESAVRFFARAANHNIYISTRLDYISAFTRKLLETNEKVYYNALMRSICELLEQKDHDIDFIKQNILRIYRNHHLISPSVFNSIIKYTINAYHSRYNRLLFLQHSMPHILEIIEVSIEKNSDFWFSQQSSNEFLQAIISSAEKLDAEHLKKAMFVITRMYQQHQVDFDNDVLAKFVQFFNHQDKTVRQANINLFKKLSIKIYNFNHEKLIVYAKDNNSTLIEKANILLILANKNLQNLEAYKELDKIIKLEHQSVNNTINYSNIYEKIKDNEQAKNVLSNLINNNWHIDDINKLTAKFTDNYETNKIINKALKKIADYKYSSSIINRNGYSLPEILQATNIINWKKTLSQTIAEDQYVTPRTIDEILDSMTLSNQEWIEEISEPENLFYSTLDPMTKLDAKTKKKYAEIAAKIKSLKYEQNIFDWHKDEIINWKEQIDSKDIKSKIAEVVAVLDQALYLTKGYYLRNTQIIAILHLVFSDGGTFAQIATGEGKSAINAVFAAIKVLQKFKVDIATSSIALAERDAKEYEEGLRGFYEILDIKVKSNTYFAEPGNDLKECYDADVVYGTLQYFIGDSLRDIQKNVKNGRSGTILFIDEADHIAMNQLNIKVQLSQGIPGFEHLKQFLYYIAIIQHNSLKFDNETGAYKGPVVTINESDNSWVIDYETVENVEQYLSNLTRAKVIKNQLYQLKQDRTALIPNHLYKFVEYHAENWINGSIRAFYYKKDVDYAIRNEHEKRDNFVPSYNIVPIDISTGTLIPRLIWADGVTQFLQIKNELKVTNEGLSSIFKSYPGYILGHKGKIYGLTGTLGGRHHLSFMHKLYDVNFVKMPTFQERKLTEIPNIIASTRKDWLNNITQVAIEKAYEDERAVLIIARSITEMKDIAKQIRSKEYNVSEYGETDNQTVIQGKKSTGTIISSTNSGGRGTDVKSTQEVIDNGGFHVIMSYAGENTMIDRQAYERAARNGEPGSSQSIIYSDMPDISEAEIFNQRDFEDLLQIKNNYYCNWPITKIKDQLFDKFIELQREVTSPTSYIITTNGLSNPNQAYLYLSNEAIRVDIIIKNERKSLNLTQNIYNIDSKIYDHLYHSLDHNMTISQRDYEIVHFLINENHPNENLDITHRVKQKIDSEIAIYNERNPVNENDKLSLSELASSLLTSVFGNIFSWFGSNAENHKKSCEEKTQF